VFAKGREKAKGKSPSFREASALIFHDPLKRLTFLGAVTTSIISFGMLTWLPSFLIRVHDVSTQTTGLYLAMTLGVMGALGTVAGGRLADALGKRDPAWIIRLPLVLLLVAKPMIAAALFVDDARLAMGLLVFPLMFGGLHFSTSLAVLHQGLTGTQKHLVSTWLLMSANLVGYTAGPLVVGMASWLLGPYLGSNTLGSAILALQCLSIVGLFFYWRASQVQGLPKGA